MNSIIVTVIEIIIIVLAVFLLCRELLCWYWKINEIRGLLEEANLKLKSINDLKQQLDSVVSLLSDIKRNTSTINDTSKVDINA